MKNTSCPVHPLDVMPSRAAEAQASSDTHPKASGHNECELAVTWSGSAMWKRREAIRMSG